MGNRERLSTGNLVPGTSNQSHKHQQQNFFHQCHLTAARQFTLRHWTPSYNLPIAFGLSESRTNQGIDLNERVKACESLAILPQFPLQISAYPADLF
jgi:hypothetical protein